MPSALRVDVHLGHFFEVCPVENGRHQIAPMLDKVARAVRAAVVATVLRETGSEGHPIVTQVTCRGLPSHEAPPVDDLGCLGLKELSDIKVDQPAGLMPEDRYEESRTIHLEFDFS